MKNNCTNNQVIKMTKNEIEKLSEQIELKLRELIKELEEMARNEINRLETTKLEKERRIERKENKEENSETVRKETWAEIVEEEEKLKKNDNKKEKTWAEIVKERNEEWKIVRKEREPRYGYCIHCRKGINSGIKCGEEFKDQKTGKKKYSCELCARKKDGYEREIEEAGIEGYKINCHICGKLFSVHEKVDLNRSDKGATCGNECFVVYIAIGRYNKQKNKKNSLEYYIEKEISKEGYWDSEYTMKEFVRVAEGYMKGEKITNERNRPTRETIDNKLDYLINKNVERYVYDDGTERYNEKLYPQEAAEHIQKYIETGDVIEIIQAVAKDPSIKISVIEEIKE
jgi:hypothetical protein